MPLNDFHQFVEALEKKRLLKRITSRVSSDLEITEITDRISKAGGPALLFEQVEGSEFPVLINAFGSYERLNIALGVSGLDEIGKRFEEFMTIMHREGFWAKVKLLPDLMRAARWAPRKVDKAPCQEVVEEPDLDALPILKCWPGDGGRFITLPLVFTRDPESGIQNIGMYRMQVYDKKTTGMHWHLHKDGRRNHERYAAAGKRMPVAVALGGEPALTYAATAPLPPFIDETLFAGFLRNAPVELVPCLTSDILVPANADFILEGYVETDELREEGPFGDHTGYYSLADMYPVFHVERVTRRKKPIYPATIVGRPPMEDCFLGKATERLFLPLLRTIFPEIVDIEFPLEGVFHNCVIVSMKKQYPGHVRKVMSGLWGMSQMMYTKMIVVVDEDIDPHDLSLVAWKVFNNIDAGRDLVVTEGPLDALDHASPRPLYGHKLGIDATRKTLMDGHTRAWPDDIVMDDATRERVTRRWKEYGLDDLLSGDAGDKGRAAGGRQ